MKTGWKTLMVTAGIVLGLSGLLLAGMGGGPRFGPGPAHEPGMGPGMGMGMMSHGAGPMGQGLGPAGPLGPAAAQLNLTDEQKQTIRTICQQSRADANEVVGAVETARAALHEAVIAGAGEEQIRAAAAKLGAAIGVQATHQAKTVAAVKAVLTEEQRAEYEKIRATVPHARQEMGGRGFGGGRPGLQSHEPAGLAAPGGPGPVRHVPADQAFAAADTNKDGVLSIEEFEALRGPVGGGWGRGRPQ